MNNLIYDPKVANKVTEDGKKFLSLMLKKFNENIIKWEKLN